ncbi:MAG: chitobiase/beta-hexosaminidase C-terminal domain-containing protein [Ruminiclostridium sp.]|nr:chitobiase/beta-hexosaminidase C-terminal domain-containing protein [Ruminiclostridium sp.]
MNLLLKKAAAVVTAGIMAFASLGAECFAESAQVTRSRVELKLEAAVAKPTYQVKGSLGTRKIALTCSTPGATIYYTTNGAVPTTRSNVYTGSLIRIASDRKIKAIAVKDGISSPVMTKTFYVNTKYGDVTGDGNINQNDYTKLKNYLAQKTKYICKDNADCNADGRVTTKDLTVLSQFLSGKVTSLPSAGVTTIKKPSATMTKVYGGKRVELACATSGATIYYTTDGSTPTIFSLRYVGPFTVDETCTINAVAMIGNDSSALRTFTVNVGTISPVISDKSTTTEYKGELSVSLSCLTSGSKIIYTTGDTEATCPDPKVSTSALTYSQPIKITKNTTIKAYAQAKGYGDSDVYTFNYKIDPSFTITGYVWDDSPSTSTTSNGQKAATETGISLIPVYLINSNTAVKDAPVSYVQRTTTDSTGKYTFSNIESGKSYKVVFEYNYQKYRAYNTIVSGGNQALPYTTIDQIKIAYNGTYAITTAGETLINNISKYSEAVNSSYYKTYAVTSSSYSQSTDNVNLALISKNYGILDLSVSVAGQDTATNTIAVGKKLTYTFTLTNNSPMTNTNLVDADVGVYLSDSFVNLVRGQRTSTLTTNFTNMTNGYVFYSFSDFIGSGGLAPGKSVSFTIEGTVNDEPGTTIQCYAEIDGYRFSNSCYDYYSSPRTLTIGGSKKERDEAVATPIKVKEDASTTNKKINIGVQQQTIAIGSYADYTFYILNGVSINDIYISSLNTTVASYNVLPTQKLSDMLVVTVRVFGESVGISSINITLAEDTKQTYTLTTNVLL